MNDCNKINIQYVNNSTQLPPPHPHPHKKKKEHQTYTAILLCMQRLRMKFRQYIYIYILFIYVACKAKWQSLWDYYTRKRGDNTRKSGQAASNKRPWHMFERMSFLKPFIELYKRDEWQFGHHDRGRGGKCQRSRD